MELIKNLSPRYRELKRLHEERRMRNLVRNKDLAKKVVLETNEYFAGGRCTYIGVHIIGQDGKNLEIEGRCFMTSKRGNWDIDTGRYYESAGMAFFSGKKKIPFHKVVDIRQ